MTDENFPSRTIIAETPVQRVLDSKKLSGVLATVPVMAERQLDEVLDTYSVVSVSGAAVFPDLPVEIAARIERSMASARSAGTRR
ncbi:MAG: integrase, partial [Rhodococcus sp. (in: high G+C Gram-positive bacteria)]